MNNDTSHADDSHLLSRRNFLTAAAAASGAAVLGACGGGTGTASGGGSSHTGGGKTGKKATLEVWSWYTEDAPVWHYITSEFHDAYHNITVKPRTFGSLADYSPALESAVSGGSTPDIFAPATLALSYGESGIALDLKDAMGAHFLDGFFPSINKEYSANGKQYAIGWEAQMFGIFYNPDIMRQAGVDVPETWDDLISAAKTIKSKTGKVPVALNGNPSNNAADFFLPLITQASDDPNLVYQLDQQVGGKKWTDNYVVQAFEMLQRLQANHVFETGADAVTYDEALALFYTQKSAMLFFGSFIVPGLLTSAPKAFNKLYRVAPTPAWRPGGRHWGGNQAGAGWSVSAKSPNADAAVEFLKFIYEPARYALIMEKSSAMAATIAAAAKGKNPIVREMASWIKDNGCNHILFGVGSETAAGNAAAAVIGGKLTPQKAAAQIQTQVDQARHA
ncbi:MAG TPA: extracellular solute-binding protein [Acidimicrobiales bacterium]|nr:extracellular solute-binding protein [Acidimicrobiales bacterium]